MTKDEFLKKVNETPSGPMKIYYTPSIEEFHEGFEFELNNAPGLSDEWTPIKISGLRFFPSDQQLASFKVRVKYLDQKDLFALGWVLIADDLGCEFRDKWWYEKEYWDEKTQSIQEMNLLYNPKNNWLLISQEYDNATRFAGYLKNKSELCNLMEMLGLFDENSIDVDFKD